MKFRKVVSLFAAAALAVSSFAGLATTASAAESDAVVGTVANLVTADATTIYDLRTVASSAGLSAYTTGSLYFDNEIAVTGKYNSTYNSSKTTYDLDGTQQKGGVQFKSSNYVMALKLAAGSTLTTNITGGGGSDRYGTLSTTSSSNGDLVTTETLGNYTMRPIEYTATEEKVVYISATGDSFISQIKVTVPESGSTDPTEAPVETEAPAETETETNVSADLTNLTTKSILTSDEITNKTQVSFGLDASGTRVASDSTDAVIVFNNAKYHSEEHGINYGSMTVPVSGTAEIKIGTCAWGGDVTVKDADGNTVATANSNTGACYHNNTTDNVITMYYKTDSATTLTITGGSYLPFVSVKAVDASEIPNDATVTYSVGSSGAEGTAPAAETVDVGTTVTIPKNTSLYVEGKTLTGWTDGTTTYAIGDTVTLTEDITLTPVFTTNTVALGDAEATVVFNFRRDQGAPVLNSQGNSTILVGQASINGTNIDVKMYIDTTSGKCNNASNTQWAQINKGTIMTVPVIAGSVVTVGDIYNNSTADAYSINGVSKTGDNGSETITEVPASGTVDIVDNGGGYYRDITVSYPQVSTATPTPTPVPAVDAYSATWTFRRDSGAPDLAIEGTSSQPYDYTVTDTDGTSRTLVLDATKGKLNNSSNDNWTQCNDGTAFTLPAYNGMKITWDCYYNSTGYVSVDDGDYIGEYIYVGDDTSLSFSVYGFAYLRTISVSPVTVYEATGTVTGVDTGVLTGSTITFTASNGQVYTSTISENNTYSAELPAGSYTVALLNDDYYIPSGAVTINSAEISALTVAKSLKLEVSGSVANPPAEAYKLVFTSLTGAEVSIDVAAGAESYAVQLSSGTYTVTSPNGALSALSSESFDVSATAFEKNIYFPEVYVAPADLSNITVGEGQQYETIRDALESIKVARSNGNSNRATIVLKAGETFREPVDITSNDVTITSDASNPAKITWYYGSGYNYYSLNSNRRYDIDRVMTKVKTYAQVNGADATDNRWGSTLRVGGTGFICENVVVENSFNQYVTDEELADGVKGSYTREKDKTVNVYAATSQAAAITIDRDNCVLYNCDFIGSQDTFFTNTQNTYVKKCIIRGQTDYIYGGGTVLFDECQLVWSGFDDEERSGYITAGSGVAGEMYIFRDCTIKYSDDTSRQYAPGNYGRTWQNAPTVYFLNCVDEDNCVSGWSGMGSGVYEVSTLGVYNFKDSSYNIEENAQNTSLTFDTAADIYENVLTTIFDGNAPKYFTNAVTKMEDEGLAGVEDTEKNDYVYGVVTEITAGANAAVTGVTWTVKASDNKIYDLSTNQEVDGTNMLSKGTFPTISGGTATVSMLFHAPQDTYEVVSIAE